MSHPSLPTPAPVVEPDTEAFWAATAQGRLLLPHCAACESTFWYPRGLCPRCGSLDIDWTEASGRGTVYSFTVIRRGDGAYAEAAPYLLAYVELTEGPRLLTNLVGIEPDMARVGQPVEVTFDNTGHDVALPRFRPITQRGEDR